MEEKEESGENFYSRTDPDGNQVRGPVPDLNQITHLAYQGLENKESYSVEEAAMLLLKSPVYIRQAVRRGELHGLMLDHQVVSISRQAITDWLHTRPGRF